MHRPRGRLIQIDVDAAALAHEQRTQVVKAMGMVGVFMGDQHAIEPVHLGVEQLHAQIGRAVDKSARDLAWPLRTLNQ